MRRALRLLPIPFSIALALPAVAQDMPHSWDLCPLGDAIPSFDGVSEPANGADAATVRAERAEQPTEIAGDRQSGTEQNLEYQGNVELRRGDQYLNADNLQYDQEQDTYVADGNVRYQDAGMRVVAEKASGNQREDTHQIENVQYQLVSRRGNGGAERIEMKGADGALIGSSYSTCDPAARHWELRSRRIEVNTDTGWGVARGASIRLGKVPVLYLPYIRFPVDDRRHTGFLYPAISSSNRNGFDYRQPFYWNIAPNYDATITPRFMSNRGIQLGTQFRYLYQGGRGVIDTAWLPTDKLVEERAQDIANGAQDPYLDPLQSENRGMFRYAGFHNLGPQWQARANLSWISDERYLEDSGSSLRGMSAANLLSTVGVFGQGRYWSAGVMADAWQSADYTLDENSLPYDRLPRLYFNMEQPFSRWLTAGLQAETVRFDHDTRAGGSRLDLKPYVSMPLQGASWYITPTLAWRYTAYQLDNELAATLPGGNDNPSRSLPIASLDAGLFFDRETEIKGSRYLHTLEPRLFYLNAPYRDQDNLPLFDTRPFTFSWGQLFRDNRYTGPDRQTDANQLTAAITTRFIRQSDGEEMLSASVGQIFYFDESRVVVEGEAPVDSGKSAWIADANYSPTDRWTLGASYQWDPMDRSEDLASLRARYLLPENGVVNLTYRYRRNLANRSDFLEQADFSFLYPITPAWSAVGRYYYSILDRKPLEALAGVQWDSCCIAVRAVIRRYVRNREGDLDNSFQVEFVLKGLGSAGRDTEGTLRRAILGYYRDDLYLVPPSNTTPDPDNNDLGPDTMP